MNAADTYEARVPETLDLAERARMALGGIAGTIDPDDEYMMWFEVYWCSNPPYLKHGGCDVECAPKFLDNITQLRAASGSDQHLDIETGILNSILRYFSQKDGLYYALYNPNRPWHMDGYVGSGYRVETGDYALPNTTGILMTVLIPRHETREDEEYTEHLKSMARGLERLSVKKGDYAYYPEGGQVGHPFSCPRTGWADTTEPGDEHEGGEGSVIAYQGYPMRGLAMWASSSGDEQALDCAKRLVRFVMKVKFWGQPSNPPRVAGAEQGHVDSHFHARAIALRGMLEYGITAGDMRVCDFVRSSYEFMRTYGINRIGWAPCWPNLGRNAMEGCYLGDLLAMTIKMSEAGLGDYWDDADRIIRNHLAEAQYIRKDLIENVIENTPKTVENAEGIQQFGDAEKVYRRQVCYDDMPERMLGIFAAYLMPTASYGRVMQCCTANASRGLYYAWEAITRCDGDEAQVNLLLNRASSWLDIDSYLPYEGRVVIRNKTLRRIAIRIPAWVNRRELVYKVNGEVGRNWMVGSYLMVESLRPGDTVELNFPVAEETVFYTAHRDTDEETLYRMKFRGNTLVDISPRDERPTVYPLYLRDQMQKDRAQLTKVVRRVVAEVPQW